MNEQNKLKILLLTSGSSPYCGSHRRLEETLDGYCGVSWRSNTYNYYIDESVLLGTKPLVDLIRHFIRESRTGTRVAYFPLSTL